MARAAHPVIAGWCWWPLALACSGCAAFTTVGAGDGSPPHPTPVAGTPWLDCKGVVHCHGHLSHDSSGTNQEIAAAAHAAGLDFVVMTDHQTDASIRDGMRGMVEGTLFVVGAEVRTRQGTVLCFPLTKPLRHFQHPALLAHEAAAQGALAFVCHGEAWQLPFAGHGLHGAEIVNLHAGARAAASLGTVATALFLPMRSLCEWICRRDERVFAAYDAALATQHPFTPIGGNDAHANVRVFGPLGGTLGTYTEVFRTLSTHALVERLDEAALVDAFRAGRTYVAFDIFGDGTGFDFRAVGPDGVVHVGGDTFVADAGVELRVSTPKAGRIRLLRDGVEVAACVSSTLRLSAPPPGVWRAEVETEGGAPWLFSSTLRLLAR